LRVITSGFHKKVIEPAPADLAKGYVAWSLTGESELMGTHAVVLHWEKPIGNLDVGKPVPLPVPYLKPRDVNLADGQIVLVKSETIEVDKSGNPTALQPIDPQRDLKCPAELKFPVESAARAFSFVSDWSLDIAATRYELERIKQSSIERAMVRMVVTSADRISVQALYQVRSAQQRLVIALPEKADFDSQPLWINGRPAQLGKRGANEFLVPLVAANADTPLVVELRYTLPGDGSRLVLPSFPEEPAAVKAYLGVYLPETRTLLGVQGPWSEEFSWRRSDCSGSKGVPDQVGRRSQESSWQPGAWLRWHASPMADPADLVRWIQEGVPSVAKRSDDFQTDGQLYLYSSLRPVCGQQGSLSLATIEDWKLNVLVFAITVLLGLLLLPARLPLRVLVVGAAVIALVLAGVFLPTFSMQILRGTLIAAVFIVAVLWTVMFAACRCKCRMPGPLPAPGPSEPGVDLSQYQPDQPVPESPPAAPLPPEPPKSDSQEGGQTNA
jgi:hypothetical protein